MSEPTHLASLAAVLVAGGTALVARVCYIWGRWSERQDHLRARGVLE